jgi:hypothetical protein
VRRSTSAEAAARFLAMRRAGCVNEIPSEWSYVDGKVPGAHAAWRKTPNLPAADFVLGVSGKPHYAVAIGLGLYGAHHERRYFVFRGIGWVEWKPGEPFPRAAP